MKTWSPYRSGLSVSMALYLALFLVATTTAETHTYTTLYTASKQLQGPEFTAVTFVDGHEIDYYDSDIRKVVPRQEWVKEVPDYWSERASLRQGEQEEFLADFHDVAEMFNHSTGTFQRMFGCELHDDGVTRGFDQYGYNGEDFITLDLKTMTYIGPTANSLKYKHRWESDTGHMERKKRYHSVECIKWLKSFVSHNRTSLKRTVKPDVQILQKEPSSPVVCFATGFYPKALMISWQKNGQDLDEDVEFRETLINDDGTFQKKCSLTVRPEEWKSDEYSCVVQHVTGEIILTQSDIKTNYGPANSFYLIAVLILIAIFATCNISIVFLIAKRKEANLMYIKLNPKD